MSRLPIEEVLPQFLNALRDHPAVILQAPPGAGKTTRVPLALLDAPYLRGKRVVMLEPRRLAAVNAACWMASCLNEEVGRTVGYAIRFERKVSAATRIEVVTEGILTRRLQSDPCLSGIGVVLFDEFHERNLHSDLALALCRDAQQGLRDDLKIVVMSATLDGGPVARMLGDAPVVSSRGRSFPVEVRYLEREEKGGIPDIAARAVQRALRETEGDILLFLPGAGEIRRCQKILEEGGSPQPLISPLYGDLPFAAQERAILPAERRRVVLATNIAETSLTIEGVRVVIDGGWSRQSRFDPASGLNRLVTVRVTKASAEQRAGRAGRLAPGICYRLWNVHTQQGLVPFNPPEIMTADLAQLALELARWGVSDAGSLSWITPPPAPALSEGRRLLANLGALDRHGLITPLGREMAELPLHPRLARMLLAGKGAGHGALACDLAALLSERDIFRGDTTNRRHASESDLLDRLEALAGWRKRVRGSAWVEADPAACAAVERGSRYWRRFLGMREGGAEPTAREIGRLLAVAYPERIAQQREPGSDRYLLANGRGGRLSPRSAVHGHPFIVAALTEGGERGEGDIRLASAISLESIRREFCRDIVRERRVLWESRERRVVAREEERLGALVLGSRQVSPTGDELCAALLEGISGGPGLAALNWTPQARQFQARVQFLARTFPEEGWPDLSDERLSAALADWLGSYLSGVRSLAELSSLDILPPLQRFLTREQLRNLEGAAPTHITVPSGSRIALDYAVDGPPVLAVRLQELFGLAETPRVAGGRVPVLLHLLSPARRPIQVTRDLKNFWDTVYPEVKKELKGRYPKHPWPGDPWSAVPTRGVRKKG